MQSILVFLLASSAPVSVSGTAPYPAAASDSGADQRLRFCVKKSGVSPAANAIYCDNLAKELLKAELELVELRNKAVLQIKKCEAITKEVEEFLRDKSETEFSILLSKVKKGQGGVIFGSKKERKEGQEKSERDVTDMNIPYPNLCEFLDDELTVDHLAVQSIIERLAIRVAQEPCNSEDCDTDENGKPSEKNAPTASGAQASQLLTKLTNARAEYIVLKKAVERQSTLFSKDVAAFAQWVKEMDLTVKELERDGRYAVAKMNNDGQETDPTATALTLSECNPTNREADNALSTPNACRDLTTFEATPLIGWEGQPKPKDPRDREFSQTLTTGLNGTNVELEFTGSLSSFTREFQENQTGKNKGLRTRRPREMTYSLGIEADATDGVAEVFSRSSNDTNPSIFSLDRLSSNVILKAGGAYNFYSKQTEKAFLKELDAFLKEAEKVCLKSLADSKTKIATNCKDEKLIVWLYESAKGKYLRKDLVEKYDKLIWKSSDDYPSFGFGGNASFGLVDKKYFRFSDAERKFDISNVGLDFFDEDGGTFSGKINDDLSVTLGGYGYVHTTLQKNKFFKGWSSGATFRLGATYKDDLEDGLDDKEVEICRADFTTVEAAEDGAPDTQIFDRGSQCKKGLPFEVELQTSWVFDAELRLGIKPIWIFPETGFAPSVAYEAISSDFVGDKFRFEAPFYFATKDKSLTGGVGYAFESTDSLDPLVDDLDEHTFFIFFGKSFSLDGSKD